MLKIGITGGIGSGKSFVAEIFRQMGFPVYDSDSRAKLLTNTNADIRRQMTDAFGDSIYSDNVLNKPKLSQLIFFSDENRKLVNGIIHPIVAEDFLQWAIEQNAPIVFFESAILFNSGFDSQMDKVILVTAPVELRIRRVEKRSQLSATEIRQRMQTQLSDEELIRMADFVIRNDEQHLLLPQVNVVLQNLSRV